MATYTGGCHCGAVRYEIETEADIEKAMECNCSHCHKKGMLLHFIDKEKFKLLSGKENLGEYQFNKKAIRHLFCKTCGTQSFAEGVSFPKACINVRCLDGVDTSKLALEPFNGKDV